MILIFLKDKFLRLTTYISFLVKKIPFWVRLILVALAIGLTGLFYYLNTNLYTITGQVTDRVSHQPLANISLSIGFTKTKTDVRGNYTFKEVKRYPIKDLHVQAPTDYIKPDSFRLYYETPTIKRDISLEPNLKKIIDYDIQSLEKNDYDRIWQLMYPDDKTYWGKQDDYVGLLKQKNDALKDLKITLSTYTIGTDIKQLPTWKSPVTGKEYQNVYEVPINIKRIQGDQSIPEQTKYYYKQVDGYYHYFTLIKKEDLQKFLDDYTKSKQ